MVAKSAGTGVVLCLAAIALADPPAAWHGDAVPVERHGGVAPAVHRWAIPSDTGSYVGYYVGGGCPYPRHADGRTPDEGTWGWDYQGWWLRRNIILGWWHGRRAQGGTGKYETDGPKLLPHHEHEE